MHRHDRTATASPNRWTIRGVRNIAFYRPQEAFNPLTMAKDLLMDVTGVYLPTFCHSRTTHFATVLSTSAVP
jgi:hypothetical protein